MDEIRTSMVRGVAGSKKARQAAMIEKLKRALLGVRNGSCWCGVGIGHPSYSRHTDACLEAQVAIDNLERES